MSWPVRKIKDFANVVSGGTPSTRVAEYWEGGDVPWLISGELKDNRISHSKKAITEKGLNNSSAVLMPPGTVLISLTGFVGQTGLLEKELSANQSVSGILPSESHDPVFIFYYLQSIRKTIESDSRGTSQKHINQKYVKNIVVPLPPIEEQRRIAAILDKAAGVERQTAKIQKIRDEIIQATFLDMFESYIKEESNKSLEDISTIVDCPHSTPLYSDIPTGYYCVRSQDLTDDGELIFDEMKEVSEEVFNKRVSRHKPREGDLLFLREGSIGRCAKIPKNLRVCLGQRIMLLSPKQDLIKSDFLHYFILSDFFQFSLNRFKLGTTAGRVNIKDLRKISVPLPPIELQNQFADIVHQINAMDLSALETQATTLRQSLTQELLA